VEDFSFDDRTWDIRYMVVGTGSWLSGRKVLIAAAALQAPDRQAKTFPVALTRQQVRNSPDIDTAKTVTRQHELDLHNHYAWPLYWGEGFYAGSMSGGMLFPPAGEEEKKPGAEAPGDSHLQSARAVDGYRLHALDGTIGHVKDFIVDDEAWIIRYLVGDLGAWLPGRKVLISPNWIESVDWETSEVFVDLKREAIRSSPEFDPSRPVRVDYESSLYAHYGRVKPADKAAGAGALPGGGKR